ncbi:MAG: hypothetical protein WCH43_07765, partial [Verrucomicrobiota bacterium]
INPLMSVNYNPGVSDPLNNADNRNASRLAFTGLVSAANAAGVGVMLDAPFNHTAPDFELSPTGAGLFGGSSSSLMRDTEARFYSRTGHYAMRASGSGNIAIAPDRGDFGKWSDVRDVYFGRYAALVDINDADNGNYLNEGDWFDYSTGDENSYGSGNGHFDGVTQNVWKYFASYTLYWLDQTGVPAGSNLATQTALGLGGLRADFGQGLPPQLWEYIINKTRARKWNFVFMAESLDGGAVTYRSNRHFDILNENIVFPLKSAASSGDFRSIFESRRSAYGQGLVLLNNMSHDEEAYSDPWVALTRYAVCSTVDGVPLVFPGQELGISTITGYSLYELNFGKNIADFKDFNSMKPIWDNTDYGNDQLYPVYSGIGQARLSSKALRSSNRWFLDGDGSNGQIFAVAKYDQAGVSPAFSDEVLAFANIDRWNNQQDNFKLPADLETKLGLKASRLYNVKNIAAYNAQDPNRRNYWLWGSGYTGDHLKNTGFLVLMNKVPTLVSSTNSADPAWNQRPYEVQYLKLYDVTAPVSSPSAVTGPRAYDYALSGSATFTWSTAAPDSEGIVPCYNVTVTINGSNTQTVTGLSGTAYTVTGLLPGQTVSISVTTANPSDPTKTGPGSVASHSLNILDPNGDADGDGMSNVAEDIAGTNPLDSASVFRVATISRSGGSVVISWSSVTGKTYVVQTTTSLSSPGSWTDLSGSSTPGTGGNVSYTDNNATGTSRFYRVRIAP